MHWEFKPGHCFRSVSCNLLISPMYHCPNHCWLTINWSSRNILQWYLLFKPFHSRIHIENDVCKMAAILFRPQCVNFNLTHWCDLFGLLVKITIQYLGYKSGKVLKGCHRVCRKKFPDFSLTLSKTGISLTFPWPWQPCRWTYQIDVDTRVAKGTTAVTENHTVLTYHDWIFPNEVNGKLGIYLKQHKNLATMLIHLTSSETQWKFINYDFKSLWLSEAIWWHRSLSQHWLR